MSPLVHLRVLELLDSGFEKFGGIWELHRSLVKQVANIKKEFSGKVPPHMTLEGLWPQANWPEINVELSL